jgi:Protein of unknown function (DUF2630)
MATASPLSVDKEYAMNDQDVLDRICALMEEEQALRDTHTEGARPLDAAERQRLQALEEALDQCWDLLRQRRAREEFGQDPDDVSVRSPETVEKYQQ